jgi:hypothetical protein
LTYPSLFFSAVAKAMPSKNALSKSKICSVKNDDYLTSSTYVRKGCRIVFGAANIAGFFINASIAALITNTLTFS